MMLLEVTFGNTALSTVCCARMMLELEVTNGSGNMVELFDVYICYGDLLTRYLFYHEFYQLVNHS